MTTPRVQAAPNTRPNSTQVMRTAAGGDANRGAHGRFIAGNDGGASVAVTAVRTRRRRRLAYLAEAEKELRTDLPAPVPALLRRVTVSALADLHSFEDEVAKRGGPLKPNGGMPAFWEGYDIQRRLVISLLEACGIMPARGRAARRRPLPDTDTAAHHLAAAGVPEKL
jgi:hypothetical protein